MNNKKDIDAIVQSMTIDDLCGQVLCYNVSDHKWSDEEFEIIAAETHPGGVFVMGATKTEIEKYEKAINAHTKAPAIVSTDAEIGPGGSVKGSGFLPQPMAWGACDDSELIERGGRATAEICRKNHIHWSFSPLLDINYNHNNPGGNVRTISDDPKQVAKIAGAYMRGLQKDGLVASTAKHFPGDGTDDRNQHFCTIINSKSKDEWMETYGYAYKELFKQGLMSVMIAHIAAPAFQEDEYDEIQGYKPGTLSYNLITKLLKNELGFEGCVVSDAVCMVGACSMVEPERLAIEFLKAGGDMILFALPEDFYYIKEAVTNGDLPIERLRDAVKRILKLKDNVHLFEDQVAFDEQIKITESIDVIANQIAEKSINIVRNSQNILPLKLNSSAKILICNLHGEKGYSLETIENELKSRGFEVTTLTNPGHRVVEQELEKNYDCILINCRISCRDYCGGSLRVDWEHIALFWRGKIFRHPKVVFTSFGDPYKLYEFPFLKTYINTFSNIEATQRAFVKVLLGELPALGKSPVELAGFFERTL